LAAAFIENYPLRPEYDKALRAKEFYFDGTTPIFNGSHGLDLAGSGDGMSCSSLCECKFLQKTLGTVCLMVSPHYT